MTVVPNKRDQRIDQLQYLFTTSITIAEKHIKPFLNFPLAGLFLLSFIPFFCPSPLETIDPPVHVITSTTDHRS